MKKSNFTSEQIAFTLRQAEASTLVAEGFCSHLSEHAVPLNEAAIRELRNNPTVLDLYAYLAYRLLRISGNKANVLSWDQLATHLGSSAESPRKFPETIWQSWDLVSAVYPNAHGRSASLSQRLHLLWRGSRTRFAADRARTRWWLRR